MNFLEVDLPRGKIAALLMLIAFEFDFLIAKREQLQRLGIFQSSAGQNIRRRGKTPHITQEVRT